MMIGTLPPAVRLGDLAHPPRAVARPVTRPPGPTVVRLWLPLTPLFLLLAPFALLLCPLLWFAPGPWRLNPLATVLGVGAVLLRLGGTDIDVRAPDAIVRLKIF